MHIKAPIKTVMYPTSRPSIEMLPNSYTCVCVCGYACVCVQNLGMTIHFFTSNFLNTLTRFINGQRDYNVIAHPANQRGCGRGFAEWVKNGQSCGAGPALRKDSALQTSVCTEQLKGVDPQLFISGIIFFLNKVKILSHNRASYIAFSLFKTFWVE